MAAAQGMRIGIDGWVFSRRLYVLAIAAWLLLQSYTSNPGAADQAVREGWGFDGW
jgi:hypothetical protein